MFPLLGSKKQERGSGVLFGQDASVDRVPCLPLFVVFVLLAFTIRLHVITFEFNTHLRFQIHLNENNVCVSFFITSVDFRSKIQCSIPLAVVIVPFSLCWPTTWFVAVKSNT